MSKLTERSMREVAEALAQLKVKCMLHESNDLRVLCSMIERAEDEALFQAQILFDSKEK